MQACACSWGALALELGCSQCWCLSSGTGKSVDKTAHFFKASCFLNIWIVSPGFLPPSNITHYCEEKFRSPAGKNCAMASACMAQARRTGALNISCSLAGLRNPGCQEAFMQDVPANAFARLLCPFPNSNCNYRDDKIENKYICSSWEKPISFAPVRNNAELLVSLTNWLSIDVVMYLHDLNILRKSMTMKCMLEV